jgi:fluoroquinolone transport system permease protein
MRRFWPALRWDWQLQWRHGLFYAAGFIVALWGLLLTQMPVVAINYVLAPVVYIDLSIFGFFFMAGLLYLEKGEGVLEALVITPLRSREYLAAKLVSLTVLGLLVSICATLLARGLAINWPVLLLAVTLNSLFFILMGFIIAVRYDAINEFFLPSIWLLGAAQAPFVDFYGVWTGWPLYFLPFQAAFLLVRGAFEPLTLWQWIYAVGYMVAVVAVSWWWAEREFERFVVRRAGAPV